MGRLHVQPVCLQQVQCSSDLLRITSCCGKSVMAVTKHAQHRLAATLRLTRVSVLSIWSLTPPSLGRSQSRLLFVSKFSLALLTAGENNKKCPTGCNSPTHL